MVLNLVERKLMSVNWSIHVLSYCSKTGFSYSKIWVLIFISVGAPKLIITDNAKTFKAASKSLMNIFKSAVVNHYLVRHNIK